MVNLKDKEKLYFIFYLLKQEYGPSSYAYWPQLVQSKEKLSFKKTLELANAAVECGRIFESLKVYSKWKSPEEIRREEEIGVDEFWQTRKSWQEANYVDFKNFITDFLHKPEKNSDVLSCFSKVQASVCHKSFSDPTDVQPASVLADTGLQAKLAKTKTFEIFENNISFLQHTDVWKWEDSNVQQLGYSYSIQPVMYPKTMYSAIFYISEYYKDTKKEIPFFFVTTLTNQILFLYQQKVEEALSYLEYICLEMFVQGNFRNLNQGVTHLNFNLDKSFERINSIFDTLKKVNPLFAQDHSSASPLFLSLQYVPRDYFLCALESSIEKYLTRHMYTFTVQKTPINIPWANIKNNFKEKCKEVEKAFYCVNS